MRQRTTRPPDTGLGSDRPDARRNDTVPVQGETTRHHGVPRAPHEHDESSDSQERQDPAASRVAKAGARDIERGVADTSKGAELDATYDKLREDLPDGEKKFRP